MFWSSFLHPVDLLLTYAGEDSQTVNFHQLPDLDGVLGYVEPFARLS